MKIEEIITLEKDKQVAIGNSPFAVRLLEAMLRHMIRSLKKSHITDAKLPTEILGLQVILDNTLESHEFRLYSKPGYK